MLFLFQQILVSLVQHLQPVKHQILLNDNGSSAKGNHFTDQTASGKNRSQAAKFVFDPVDDPVKHSRIAVYGAGLHAVDGVFSDQLFWRIEADTW